MRMGAAGDGLRTWRLLAVACSLLLAALVTMTMSVDAAQAAWMVERLPGSEDGRFPEVEGDHVTWVRDPDEDGGYTLLLRSLVTGQTWTLSHTVADPWRGSRMSDGKVVWEETSGPFGPSHAVVYDIAAGTRAQLTSTGSQVQNVGVTIEGSFVKWVQAAGAGELARLFLHDTRTGQTQLVAENVLPHQGGDPASQMLNGRILWRAQLPGGEVGISLYDIPSGKTTWVTDYPEELGLGRLTWFGVTYYGNTEVGDDTIHLYDPASGEHLLPAPLDPRRTESVSGRWSLWNYVEGGGGAVALYDGVRGEFRELPEGLASLYGRGLSGHTLALERWETGGSTLIVYDLTSGDTTSLGSCYDPPSLAGNRVIWVPEWDHGSGESSVYLATRAGTRFPDTVGSPHLSAIEALAAAGVVGGYEDGTFGPGDPLLRAQFAKMIDLTLDLPVSEGGAPLPFSDVEVVADDLYPDDYVAFASQYGVVEGTGGGLFAPFADVRRAQVLTMVVRAAKRLKPSALATPPANWEGRLASSDPTHGANIRSAEYSGLLTGVHTVGWDVWEAATRGEVAQILWNLRVK